MKPNTRAITLSLALILVALPFSVDAARPQTKKLPAPPPSRDGAVPAASQVAPDLTNQDVMRLAEAGLGEPLIIARIRQAKTPKFDLSTEALLKLHAAKVSDQVIAVMLDPTATAPVVAPPTPAAPTSASNPAVPREPGIYVDLGSTEPNLVPLEPTVFSQGKTGGMFTSALTYGLYKAKWKAVVRSPRAGQRVGTPQPVFYFYFESRSAGAGGVFGGALASASNPNEFVLVRMTRKADARELIVGEFGAFGASSGTRSEDTADLRVEKVGPGVYRVTPAVSLLPGEYCFFYTATAPTTGAATVGKLFDFGIDGADSPETRR